MRRVGILLVLVCMCASVFAEEGAGDGDKKGKKHRGHHGDWKKYDKDGDGKFSNEEKAAARDAWRIKRYDKDGDGRLSEEETAAADEAKKNFMTKYDKDGDGKISDEEKKALREAHRKRRSKDRDKKKESDKDPDGGV